MIISKIHDINMLNLYVNLALHMSPCVSRPPQNKKQNSDIYIEDCPTGQEKQNI